MSEVSGYIPGPYQGVSQAPPQVRLAGTCNFMEDCLAVIPMGIQKRPPVVLLADLGVTGDDVTTAFIQEIPGATRAADLTLVLLTQGGGTPHAFLFNSTTMAPVACSIDVGSQAYLSGNTPNPGIDYRALTIEDVTFITNRLYPVSNAATTAATRPHEALVFVKTGGYARTYNVTVDYGTGSVSAAFATSSGATAADVLATGTDRIALALFDGTDPSAGHDTVSGTPLNTLAGAGFTVTIHGAVIYISHPTNDFTVVTTDDQGGTGMIAIKGQVQRFSDLPAVAVNGFTVKIAQSASGADSDYFVTYTSGASAAPGVWVETVEPGSVLGVDYRTLPVTLRNSGGAWSITQPAWSPRTVGNPSLVPDPAFIGDTITDVSWWKGRLALLSSGGSVRLSRSDSPYKLYPTTLAASLDSDPIETLNPCERKSYFSDITTFDQRMVFWGDQAQGILQAASKVATSSNVGADPIGDTPFHINIPPQGSNHRAYYAALRTTGAVVYELSIDRISGQVLPEEMTKAVPTYLPSTINRVATSKTEFLTVYGTSSSPTLYVHGYRYSGQENVQNAFYKWTLPYPLAGMFFRQGTLLMVFMKHTNGHLICGTMDIAPLKLDPSGAFLSHLDMRFSEADVTFAYNAAADLTTITLPLAISTAGICQYRSGSSLPGYRPTIASFDGTTMVLNGDHRTQPLWVGVPYLSQFSPTRTYKFGQDQRVDHTGLLNLKKYKLDLADVGYLRILVEISGRAPMTYTFEGRLQDSDVSALDLVNLIPEIVYEVPLGAPNTQVKVTFQNDSPLGFKLLGYEWEGDFTPRSQRVT